MLSSKIVPKAWTRTLGTRLVTTTAASVCNALGSPLSYQLDWPVPSPSKNQVMIKVAATGVNFAEILQTRGLYQEKKEPPFVPGNECAGEVCEVGPGTSRLEIGDKVICLARGNGYAGHVVADARACIKLPPAAASADLAEAAALLVNYGTAHLALGDRAGLRSGETVLVTAAAGGVGMAAVELAKLMGAGKVIAAVGSPPKLEFARSKGSAVDVGVVYEGLDQRGVRGAIKEAAPDGVDVVVDMVGADVLEPCLRSLRWGGRGVVIGFAGGSIPAIPSNVLLVKNISVHGLFWGAHLLNDPDTLLRSAEQLVDWWLAGDVKPHICERVPLDDANRAFQLLDGRGSTGKVVLIP